MRDYLAYLNVSPFFSNQVLAIFLDESFLHFPLRFFSALLSLFVGKIMLVKIFTTPTTCKRRFLKTRNPFKNINIVKLVDRD